MEWFEALILGLLQGLTEYLPVSSSGHLAIGSALFGIQGEDNLTFTIANKEMDPVYTTGSSLDNLYQEERQVHRNIVVYRKFFEKDPKVQFWNARGKETLWLFTSPHH